LYNKGGRARVVSVRRSATIVNDKHTNTRLIVFVSLFYTVLAAVTGCASQAIQITPNEKEPVREERSKYGVTCYGPNLNEFQWRGPSGIISQSPQFR